MVEGIVCLKFGVKVENCCLYQNLLFNLMDVQYDEDQLL